MDNVALQGLGGSSDPTAQRRAVEYFEHLKSSENGWQMCADTLNTSGVEGDHVRFFCLQVVEHFIKTKYATAAPSHQQKVKEMLMLYLQMQACGSLDKTFLRNKAAQLFSLVFVADYPRQWPTFFTDLICALNLGVPAVDLFLRVLMAIDSEMVDRDIVHTMKEVERNTVIKDAMREQCVPALVDSWYQILTTYETSHPEQTCMCLEAVGHYISWIDINLIANDRFIPTFVRYMSMPMLRESAADCFKEIISKGMDACAKMKLIDSLMTVLENAGIFNLAEDEDADYLVKLAAFVNTAGNQLLLGFNKTSKSAKTTAEGPAQLQSIEKYVPLMLRFLGNDDDDVSTAVCEFASDYVALLKTRTTSDLSQTRRQNVETMLYTVITKMKYDDSYNFDSEEVERNTVIKDAMREQCVPALVDSWYQILTTYETSHPEQTCMCLEAVGHYISWIDINLIANDRFIPTFVRYMSMPMLRESAADCFKEIISKGMDACAKMKLIDSLMTVLENAGIFNLAEDEDADYLVKLAAFVNTAGNQLLLGFNKTSKSAKTTAEGPAQLQSIEKYVPLMLRFLGNDDDDVSTAVCEFASDYVALLKTRTTSDLSQTLRQNVETMLYTVITKMKYDDSYNFDSEYSNPRMFLCKVVDEQGFCQHLRAADDTDGLRGGHTSETLQVFLTAVVRARAVAQVQSGACAVSARPDGRVFGGRRLIAGTFPPDRGSACCKRAADGSGSIQEFIPPITRSIASSSQQRSAAKVAILFVAIVLRPDCVGPASAKLVVPLFAPGDSCRIVAAVFRAERPAAPSNRPFRLGAMPRTSSGSYFLFLSSLHQQRVLGNGPTAFRDSVDFKYKSILRRLLYGSRSDRPSRPSGRSRQCYALTSGDECMPLLANQFIWPTMQVRQEVIQDRGMVLLMVHSVVTSTLQQWDSAKFEDVELAIFLLYNIGEALPASQGNHFIGDDNKVVALKEMMRLLISSHVSRYSHTAVQLQFFETVVRYEKYFNCESDQVPEVMVAFLDSRGLHHQSCRVRSRVSYLFSRFIKSSKAHLQPFVEDILKQLEDLLVVPPAENGIELLLSPDDQLFLYEAAAVLIVSSSFEPQKKQLFMKSLLAPIVRKFSELLEKLALENNEQRQQLIADALAQAMAFASRTSKAFSNQQPMKQCGCVEAYTETLQVFLTALSVPVQVAPVQSGVRQYLHRMVVCLEDDVMPYIPVAVEALLQRSDARSIQEFIPLINQIVAKFKKLVVPLLQQVFMPFVRTVFSVLSVPAPDNDLQARRDAETLQRSYFLFLSSLINNGVTEVIAKQAPQDMQEVLSTVIHGAVNSPDPVAQKTCFNILRRLVESWGTDDSVQGFVDFMYKSILPACFMAPLRTTFDLQDAQTVLALNECALCLKTIADKRGDECIRYLQNSYLPTMQVAPEVIQEYCLALKSDQKVFKSYLKVFFQRAKT
ncbi:PREDICTED: exportin-T-like [Priapulus caudatus]|uniref:Exportin-T n=1 Tax=Priapulus caudatus TaxID=37621 RepID=A0ABM1DWP8_PRICU|nr:PREDICTED: exportin-T-like [Priapulus caudatus]